MKFLADKAHCPVDEVLDRMTPVEYRLDEHRIGFCYQLELDDSTQDSTPTPPSVFDLFRCRVIHRPVTAPPVPDSMPLASRILSRTWTTSTRVGRRRRDAVTGEKITRIRCSACADGPVA